MAAYFTPTHIIGAVLLLILIIAAVWYARKRRTPPRPSIASQFGDTWQPQEARYKTMFKALPEADQEVVWQLEQELEPAIAKGAFSLQSALQQDYSPAAQACVVEMLKHKGYQASFPGDIFTATRAVSPEDRRRGRGGGTKF